jgi:hypothetical protein
MPESKSVNDLDFLQELIDTPDPPKTSRARKPKDVRSYDAWFKLDHIVMGTCSRGENCAAIILDSGRGPGRVTAIVNEVEMCRFDYLDGLAYTGE